MELARHQILHGIGVEARHEAAGELRGCRPDCEGAAGERFLCGDVHADVVPAAEQVVVSAGELDRVSNPSELPCFVARYLLRQRPGERPDGGEAGHIKVEVQVLGKPLGLSKIRLVECGSPLENKVLRGGGCSGNLAEDIENVEFLHYVLQGKAELDGSSPA